MSLLKSCVMDGLGLSNDLALSSLSENHVKGANGGVTPDTYIAFVIIECIA